MLNPPEIKMQEVPISLLEFYSKNISKHNFPQMTAKFICDYFLGKPQAAARAFGGLAATRLQPENFQKIRAGWPYSEPRLIQLERLEF